MEHIEDILRRLLQNSPCDQVFFVEDEDGMQYFWNVNAGYKIAQESADLRMVSLVESGITLEFIRKRYTGMDETYALTTDTTRPILFIPHNGMDQLLDGWHRIAKAAILGQQEIPAYFLTQQQADSILILKLPAHQGIDWGQKQKSV